jgi:hypothetical protein
MIYLIVNQLFYCLLIMYYSVSSKCKIIKKIFYDNKNNIIFFKKKILDKASFRYYICTVKFETNLLKGGVDYDCFIVLSKTNRELN